MAAQRIRSVLDVENMTNKQLLRELGRLNGEILLRLSNCLEMGEESEIALDEGILLGCRAARMAEQFRFGGCLTGDGDAFWRRGVCSYNRQLEEAALAVSDAS